MYKNTQATIILVEYSTRPQGWEYGCGFRFSSGNIRPGLASQTANVLFYVLLKTKYPFGYTLQSDEAPKHRDVTESRTIPNRFCLSSSALLCCQLTVHSSTLVQPMSDYQVLHTGITRSPNWPIGIKDAQRGRALLVKGNSR